MTNTANAAALFFRYLAQEPRLLSHIRCADSERRLLARCLLVVLPNSNIKLHLELRWQAARLPYKFLIPMPH